MRKRAKGCFECKELNDVLYRCRYGGEKTWIFLCENCFSLVKKKYQLDYQYGKSKKAKSKEFGSNVLIISQQSPLSNFIHYITILDRIYVIHAITFLVKLMLLIIFKLCYI